MSDQRQLLVDASVFITLAEIDALSCLESLDGTLVVPSAVRREVNNDPAKTQLERLVVAGTITELDWFQWSDEKGVSGEPVAATHLGTDPEVAVDTKDSPARLADGDVALLCFGRHIEGIVVLTDDKPLKKTCKSLSIPVSGSIAVLVRAVESGQYTATQSKNKLYAMDEVGARLSASLVKRAEKLIDDAAD
ncbi:hypothetical protein [Haloarcula onubensis]|uniref:PIN domain-containing protein n=1 Tax=Haloarcula onubensis TaxID=2950539 RepID=A0ABU2FJ97_9EURY|nr:hypothetical protein [Halomicroarcula sp. S3CR25-11]MDS0280828.1 hypothetical protein [Halomicroarcula sp. S3CR25-11]